MVDGESRQAFFVYLADGGERPVVQKLDLVRNFPRAEPHTGQLLTQLLIVSWHLLRDDKRANPLAKQPPRNLALPLNAAVPIPLQPRLFFLRRG